MIEYVLLVSAVLLVCIYFFSTQSSPMSTAVNAGLNTIVNQIDNLNSQIHL